MITFDRTACSVVVACACGAREVLTNRAAADRWALAHVDEAHPAPDLDALARADRDRFLHAVRERQRLARLA